jgi:hypothetical protein
MFYSARSKRFETGPRERFVKELTKDTIVSAIVALLVSDVIGDYFSALEKFRQEGVELYVILAVLFPTIVFSAAYVRFQDFLSNEKDFLTSHCACIFTW